MSHAISIFRLTTTRILSLLSLAALPLILSPHLVDAQSTENVPLEKVTPGLYSSPAIGGNLAFSSYLEAGRSYECAVFAGESSTVGSNPGREDTRLRILPEIKGPSGNVTATLKGLATPVINADQNDSDNSAGTRVTLTAETDGYYEFTVRSLADDSVFYSDGTGSFDFRIACHETTLYGGFNTNINDFNFLELTNTSNATITAKIKAVRFDGTVAIEAQTVSIPAGIRSDLDLHSAVGSQVYGSLIVTHDAALGSLTGYVSQYAATGDSFVLSTSLPLSTRERP